MIFHSLIFIHSIVKRTSVLVIKLSFPIYAHSRSYTETDRDTHTHTSDYSNARLLIICYLFPPHLPRGKFLAGGAGRGQLSPFESHLFRYSTAPLMQMWQFFNLIPHCFSSSFKRMMTWLQTSTIVIAITILSQPYSYGQNNVELLCVSYASAVSNHIGIFIFLLIPFILVCEISQVL